MIYYYLHLAVGENMYPILKRQLFAVGLIITLFTLFIYIASMAADAGEYIVASLIVIVDMSLGFLAMHTVFSVKNEVNQDGEN